MKNQSHENNFKAFLLYSNMSNINSTFTTGMKFEFKRNKAILESLIGIIKLIGKQGLSYCGAKDAEAAYILSDSSLDH